MAVYIQRNTYIGIALTGYDEFTTAQKEALLNLLTALGVQRVERHHEQCPGPGLNVELINLYLSGENP